MSSKEPENARERILKSGLKVFADKGFSDATLRVIATDTEANLSSIFYILKIKMDLESL